MDRGVSFGRASSSYRSRLSEPHQQDGTGDYDGFDVEERESDQAGSYDDTENAS